MSQLMLFAAHLVPKPVNQLKTHDSARTCNYTHHAHPGQPVEKCPKCGTQMVCGPRRHYCLKCEPSYKDKCPVCGSPQWNCNC
jgi:hypothetical protein